MCGEGGHREGGGRPLTSPRGVVHGEGGRPRLTFVCVFVFECACVCVVGGRRWRMRIYCWWKKSGNLLPSGAVLLLLMTILSGCV